MLDPKGLEAAYSAGRDYVMEMDDRTKQMLRIAIRAYLSTITPAEAGGLVERLRAVTNRMTQDFDGRDDLMREAATALEDLAADNERLTRELTAERAAHAETRRERDELAEAFSATCSIRERLASTVVVAEAQRDEALKALVPLKKLADEVFRVDEDGREMNASKPDDAGLWGFDNVILTYGDLRTARRALTGGKNG